MSFGKRRIVLILELQLVLSDTGLVLTFRGDLGIYNLF